MEFVVQESVLGRVEWKLSKESDPIGQNQNAGPQPEKVDGESGNRS